MKILIVGGGGREHALALTVKKSPLCKELICAPGNPGTALLGKNFPADMSDPQSILAVALAEKVDFTIVGPEIPLVAGVVDLFNDNGLTIFGPTAAAAALEGSKAFSKAMMEKYQVPTALHQTFTDLDSALAHLKANPAPVVVKASGLAAGKGALVCMTDDEAVAAVESMLGADAQFGEAGKTVVIEEYMEGEEASIFAVSDGQNYVLLASAQDHKRAYDGDEGPNTGGMGAYAPAPLVDDALLNQVCEEIIEPTLIGMQKEGIPYVGVLYVGIMLTKEGPKVVEYNCRFGDPEAQVILPLYKGDIVQLLLDASNDNLQKHPKNPPVEGSAAIVVLASDGYPGDYEAHKEISGIDRAEASGAQVLHAGTTLGADGKLLSAGGRVLGVVAQDENLKLTLEKAYAALKEIHFQGCFYRQDIGQKGLKNV
ncbi:MAG: phosphoribosylamine--glycine ligase [Fibrobacter sp.]|nr:phosphoribosylamine--glycine ligase [Fibrobacter sp.]